MKNSNANFSFAELERNNVYEFKIAALTSNGTGPFTEDWLQEYTTDRDQSGKSLMLYKKKYSLPWKSPLTAMSRVKTHFM